MRKIGTIAGIVFLVLVTLLVIFATTLDINKYRPTIQSQLENQLGRPVLLGDMSLGFFPPRFRVRNLSIAEDPAFSRDAPFIKAQELGITFKLLPLLKKQLEIDSMTLQRPTLNLIKNPSGQWNFASLAHPSTEPKARPTSQRQFSLKQLTIQDGQVSLLDQRASKTPTLYNHIDITLANFAPNTPFTIDAAAQMAGAGSQKIRLQGEGGPLVRGDFAATPLRATLDFQQVGIADLAKFLNSPTTAGTDGVLTGKTKIQNDSAKLTAQGEANIASARVKGMELGYPITVQYDVTSDSANRVVAIRNMLLKLGRTPLQMSGTVNTRPTPSQLALRIKANNVSLTEAAKLLSASGMALSQGITAAGNASADIHATGAINKPVLNGMITGSNIQLTGNDIRQPILVPSVTVNLTPTQVQSNAFRMISGDTTLTTQFAIQNYASPSPVIEATARALNAQLPAVLSLAKAYGVTSLDKVKGDGTMDLDVRASGPMRSLRKADILRALNGNADVKFNNVQYSGANVVQQLASIAGSLNPDATAGTAQDGGVTNISRLTGDIAIRNGIAQTNNLQAQLDFGTVGLAGTANLVNEALNMRVTAVLSKAFSQKIGGQNIAGMMKTALANPQGELVIPATMTGTFSNPSFQPDYQQIAQMQLKGFIPNMNNPASVAGAIQNLIGGPKPRAEMEQQPQAQPEAEPQDPLQQLIGIFGKKKQEKQQPAEPPK